MKLESGSRKISESVRAEFFKSHEDYQIPIIRNRIRMKEWKNLTPEEALLVEIDREDNKTEDNPRYGN